jgi:hypothetical protein
MRANQSKFFNPELHLTKEEEAERKKLVRKLDKALALGIKSKKEEAECWALLNPLYSKPGCKGRWKKFVTSKGHKISTVNGLIKRLKDGWQKSARKPKPRLNQPNSGRFTEPHLAFTDKPFPDGKEILEAAFLLTPDEKDQFMEALRIIGPEEALGIMFQAVVDHVERMRAGVTTRLPLENPFDRSDRMMILADDENL